ncbi:TRAP transporter substrate-binding protein [Pikeienuella sp. HZG-20]|uniref:TRAP transporter substrate-binding protein n=1 Tax=Paludibacillus litoralis TaxID=3133267 RepID=UPI0030ED6666
MTVRMISIAAALGVALAGAASAQEKITLQLGTAGQPSWSLGKVVNEVLKPKIEEYSEGRIEVVVHAGGSLCSEQACVEQMGLGQIDMATVSSGNVGAFGTTFDIINLPFLFRDQDAASAMLNGWLAEELADRAKAEMNMHMIALIPVGGFRNLVNTEREARVPADLNGMKIRVTKSPTEFNLVKAWGAAPIPYDWASLYEGLQSGVVQGMYLQDTFTAAGKFYEVVTNITEVAAAWSAHPILMTEERYQALPDWARAAIDKAGADVQRAAFDYDVAWQSSAVTAMEGKVAVYRPTEAEMDLWRAGARDAWVAVKGAYDPALARRILSEQKLDTLIGDLEAAGAL